MQYLDINTVLRSLSEELHSRDAKQQAMAQHANVGRQRLEHKEQLERSLGDNHLPVIRWHEPRPIDLPELLATVRPANMPELTPIPRSWAANAKVIRKGRKGRKRRRETIGATVTVCPPALAEGALQADRIVREADMSDDEAAHLEGAGLSVVAHPGSTK